MEDSRKRVGELFGLFDLNGAGAIETRDLGNLMRALWRCPGEDELEAWAQEADPQKSGKISFEAVVSLLGRTAPIDIEKTREELLDAFMIFDQDKSGLVQEAELRHVLTSLGEKLSEPETNEFIQDAGPDGEGWIDYRRLVEKMLSRD